MASRRDARAMRGGAPHRSCRSAPRLHLLLLSDVEELDLEDERRAARDLLAGAFVAVREVGRDREARLAADLHKLEPLGPARDHAAQRELDRLPDHTTPRARFATAAEESRGRE